MKTSPLLEQYFDKVDSISAQSSCQSMDFKMTIDLFTGAVLFLIYLVVIIAHCCSHLNTGNIMLLFVSFC